MWQIKAIIKNKLRFKIMDMYNRFPITSTLIFHLQVSLLYYSTLTYFPFLIIKYYFQDYEKL